MNTKHTGRMLEVPCRIPVVQILANCKKLSLISGITYHKTGSHAVLGPGVNGNCCADSAWWGINIVQSVKWLSRLFA